MAAKHLITLTIVVLAASRLVAQDLPDAIRPKPTALSRSWDTPNKISLFASIAVRTADTVQTCHMLHRKIAVTTPQGGTDTMTWNEQMAPVNSCGGVTAWNAGIVAAGFAGTWILNKTGHHKLARIPNWISAGGSAVGIAYTSSWSPQRAGFPAGSTYRVIH